MVTKAAKADEPVSKLQSLTSLPKLAREGGGVRASRPLDTDILEALNLGGTFSVKITDTPEVTKKGTGGQKHRNFTTADSYLRQHAAHLGLGLSTSGINDKGEAVKQEDATRVAFVAQVKRVVPSGANRAKRGTRVGA